MNYNYKYIYIYFSLDCISDVETAFPFYSLYWKPQPRKNILQYKVPKMIGRAQSTKQIVNFVYIL
jgi:hypothetical protein